MKSQTELENHKKYWYYKTRLNNDFVKIGHTAPNGANDETSPDHGESQPFNERGYYDANDAFISGGSKMNLGDGGTRQGIYIGVLATEYRLLKNNGQDVSKIKHELFCALNAFNRIDYYAESIYSQGTMSPNLNGFFIREDATPNFVQNNYKHFNYYSGNTPNLATDKGFTQTFNGGQNQVGSSYQDILSDPTTKIGEGTGEESQDQVYYLLMGTALVSQLVDAGETDGTNVFAYGSGETELKKEAINISDRLIKHIKNSAGGIWTIRNPARGNAFVHTGQHVGPFAYAVDNSGCFIKYGQDLPFVYMPLIPGLINDPFNTCTDYRNLFSATIAPNLWNLNAQIDGGPTVDEQGFFHALAGVCNCIYEDKRFANLNVQQALNNVLNQINNVNITWNNLVQTFLDNLPPWVSHSATWVTNMVNQINTIYITILNGMNSIANSLIANLFPSFKTNTTDQRLVNNTYFNNVQYNFGTTLSLSHLGSDQYFGIYLRDVLHPNSNIIQLPSWLQFSVPIPTRGKIVAKSDMQNILNGAPCQGNYRMFPAVPSPYWGASNRLDRTDPLWRPSWGDGNQGEYNGTDYMLLHNLYYLTEGATIPLNDYSERNVTSNMPFASGWFSLSNKKTVGAFENIIASNTIAYNGAADYRAGKEIALLPNFSAALGSNFSAFISPYACSGSGEAMRTAGGNSDDFYEGSTNNFTKPASQANVKEENNQQDGIDDYGLNKFNSQLDSIMKNTNEKNYFTSKIEVYPNPNNGEFNIEFNLSNMDNVDVVIYDVVGKEIYNQKNVVGYIIMPINLKDYDKGIYVVRLKNSNGIEYYKKVTIQ